VTISSLKRGTAARREITVGLLKPESTDPGPCDPQLLSFCTNHCPDCLGHRLDRLVDGPLQSQ